MKHLKRGLVFLLVLVMMVGSLSVSAFASEQVDASKGKVTSVTITKPNTKTLVLKKGKTYTLKTKVKTSGKKVSKKLTFASSNKKVVTVSSNGKLKAVKNGKATITVKSKANPKKKATLKVIVNTPVTKVKLNKTKLTLTEGKKATLKATISPKKATIKKVTYTSSNKSVATVDKNGKVTAKKAGKATITATAADGTGKKATCKVTVKAKNVPDLKDEFDSSVDGYTKDMMQWNDEFDGTELNKEDWNVELHEKGWVNDELQEYVDTTDNISVQDGNLVITSKKNDEKITSGRINTQNKHDFKYGVFEVKAKVPEGKGFLPAFWLMPTDENLYGQWPKCGEIDAMEVMGQETNKLYGTIHYGEPHKENQGTKILESGSFSDDYHVFAVEWNPGKISWYVDGEKYYETQNWYSQKINQGIITYPAPFDQDFYMILNLAVGGSWVGNPDADTVVDGQQFLIDYVRVYQKAEYDEDVVEPGTDVVLPTPDASGNYVRNGDFAVAEDLTDDEDWKFMTALGGDAEAVVAGNEIKITTKAAGEKDYSVQLVQPGMPIEKGAEYTVSFDAKASAARMMNCAVKAPDFSYEPHMTEMVSLTTDWQTYSYTCTLNDGFGTDPNCRLEFNMGNANSTATIEIKNVSYKKTKDAPTSGDEAKSVRADGNLIYNGKFQEGAKRLGFWTIKNDNGAEVKVTDIKDGRQLFVNGAGVEISQDELPVDSGIDKYSFSMKVTNVADTAATISYNVLGVSGSEEIAAGATKTVSKKIAKADINGKKIVISFPATAMKIDDVRVEEDALIKNGNFNGGETGYEWYADSSATATFVVNDKDEANNSFADITVYNTGDQDWKIQLKQNNVPLENGKCYKLAFDAKSSKDRKIRVIMQGKLPDASKPDGFDYPVYSGENTVELTSEYQTFEKYFKMEQTTDPEAYLSICLGAVGGKQITEQHRVCIDNISLVEIDESEMPAEPEIDPGENLLAGLKAEDVVVTAPAAAVCTDEEDGAIKVAISNVGDNEWDIKIGSTTLNLKKNAKYKISFKAKSTVARTIKAALNTSTDGYIGGVDVNLEANVLKTVSQEVETGSKIGNKFAINLGHIADWSTGSAVPVDTPISDIYLYDISLIELESDDSDPEPEPTPTPTPFEGSVLYESEEGFVINWSVVDDLDQIVKDAITDKKITVGDVIRFDVEKQLPEGATDDYMKLVLIDEGWNSLLNGGNDVEREDISVTDPTVPVEVTVTQDMIDRITNVSGGKFWITGYGLKITKIYIAYNPVLYNNEEGFVVNWSVVDDLDQIVKDAITAGKITEGTVIKFDVEKQLPSDDADDYMKLVLIDEGWNSLLNGGHDGEREEISVTDPTVPVEVTVTQDMIDRITNVSGGKFWITGYGLKIKKIYFE